MREVNIAEFEESARRAVPRFLFDFAVGGADDELTLAANRNDFARITLRPRVLVDVTECSTSTRVFEDEIAVPVMLAPSGLAQMWHPKGELAVARAAGRQGTIYAVAASASYTVEEVAAAAAKPLWFQLYSFGGRDVMEPLIRRAQAAGYHALCFTVDVATVGKRERDMRNGMTVPPRIRRNLVIQALRRPRWLMGYLSSPRIRLKNMPQEGKAHRPGPVTSLLPVVHQQLVSASRTWDDVAWLRDLWRGPLLIKGILTAEDAETALRHGVDGIIVSNHGGRQLDGAPATIAVLPEIVAAVSGRAEVYLDGGVRRGTDVIKAIALGARAVLIGRPYLYGLAAYGEKGVDRVLEMLRGEVLRTLMLLGRRSIAEIDRSVVRPRAEPSTVVSA